MREIPYGCTFALYAAYVPHESRPNHQWQDFFSSPRGVRACFDPRRMPPIWSIDALIVREDLADDSCYWGWWDAEEKKEKESLVFVWQWRILVEMCFADVRHAENEDRGRIVRVRVTRGEQCP